MVWPGQGEGAPGEIESGPVVPSEADRLGEAGEAVLQGEVEVLREGADLARCGEVGARRGRAETSRRFFAQTSLGAAKGAAV